MTDTPSSGTRPDADDGFVHAGPVTDSEPIDAEFRQADPEPGGSSSTGPGWTGALALAVLAALGGSVGGTFGARLLVPDGTAPAGDAGAVSALREQVGDTAEQASREAAALGARLDVAETRAAEISASVTDLRESLGALAVDVEKVDRVATFDRRLSALETASDGAGDDASASDVAMSALTSRLDALEGSVDGLGRAIDAIAAATDGVDLSGLAATLQALEQGVATLEAETASLAELQGSAAPAPDATLALALADITRAAAAGDAFAGPHADLAAALPNDGDVAALAPLASAGVPTLDELAQRFDTLAPDALAADPREPEGGLGLAERLFGDQIRVRREGEVSVADQIERAQAALAEGALADALAATDALPEPVLAVLEPWRAAVGERLALEAALDGLRRTLAMPVSAAEAQP